MKITTSLILLLLSIKAFSQTERITEFYPLTPIDTINNFKELKKSERIDSLNSSDFFFTYKDHEYERGLLLNKKSNDKWIIYEFDSEFLSSFSSPNMSVGDFRIEDEKYIFIEIFTSPSGGGCSSLYEYLIILNIETCKTMEFCNYHHQTCYDYDDKSVSQSECRTTTKLEKGILSLKSSENIDRLHCIESAEYKIKNDSLIKTKYYLETHRSFYPIICNEEYDICTGTGLYTLKSKFSNAIFKEAPIFEYGYDSETIGKEFYTNNELQLFVVFNEFNIATGISFVSPRYTFDGISTETKVSEILNKYTTSKLHIDLISDWEYIFIKELYVKFVFKTNNSNRIGFYPTDFEDGTRKIQRPNVTIDFIQI